MGKTLIISFINYKGGVGKTTSCFHIASTLALEKNKSVLLIDLDPQTNLTFLIFTISEYNKIKKEKKTIMELFNGYINNKPINLENIIISPSEYSSNEVFKSNSNLDIVSGNINLIDLEESIYFTLFKNINDSDERFVNLYLKNQVSILNDQILKIKDKYDYIFIDCPPNLSIITQNGIYASEKYLITTTAEHLSAIGLKLFEGKIADFKKKWSERLSDLKEKKIFPDLLGILFVKILRGGKGIPSVISETKQEIEQMYSDKCFIHYTTQTTTYSDSAKKLVPIFSNEEVKNREFQSQYLKITDEFLEKIGDN